MTLSMVTKRTFSRVKLLVIDDDPLLTEFLREGLKTHFSLIVVAASVNQAKSLIDGPFIFNAIVCDYQLADGNGMMIYDWLRQERNNPVPFLLISGKVDPIHNKDPMFDFLAKPFSPYDLLEHLERFQVLLPTTASAP